jgi:sugar phosphate isomerase/epimerase
MVNFSLSRIMKKLLLCCLPAAGIAVLSLGFTSCASRDAAGGGRSFNEPVGLQLYSLRDQFKKDVPGTLDLVRNFGFQYVELAGTYGLPPEQFRAMLEARGLKAVAILFPYDRYSTDIEGIAREARALGVGYVGCAWIPQRPFDEKACREAIALFNAAGEALQRHGLRFFYHIHGYEFAPHGDGTLFDLMMRETRPEHVSFQMDTFWAVHPGQNPVRLLERYGNRWELMHLKDMRKGTPTGLLTGNSPVTNNVPLGTGMIDMREVLRAAQKAGVKWYFIEDESPTVEQQIPESLEYLRTLRL